MSRICLILWLVTLELYLFGQCPVITETSTTPNCIPSCEMCDGGRITINLRGGDLPHNGKIEYFADENSGFNPYLGQGTKIGEAMISTPNIPCRICPQMLGFIIDACGTEVLNEVVLIWTGSGFNTSNLNFDFDPANNAGGGNNDIGSGGCGLTAGNAGLIGGCMATSVGPGYNLPANAILILFTSTGATTNYDFGAICGLGLKVFVISNACTRTAGAFSNLTSTGMRTQTFSVSGCGCSTSVTYDTDDPNLSGDGDNWAGGIGNNGCAAPDVNTPNYTPAPSTIQSFSYTIPASWCDKTYEIVGIVNPRPDPMCCGDVFTERIEIKVKCPKAKTSSMETCEIGNGAGTFDLTEIIDEILDGGNGTVEFYRDAAGNIKINPPLTTTSTTIYARVVDGTCKSSIVPIQLKVNPLPLARKASDEKCDEGGGAATFDLINLIQTINLNNNNLTVQFYRDALLNDLITPPYISKSGTIYATTFDGKCESRPVEITLIVLPLPSAKSTSITACDEGDGKGTFNLQSLKTIIQGDTISSKQVRFYDDLFLTNIINSPFRSAKDTLYAVVFDGKCNSLPVAIYLELGNISTPLQISDTKCADINGNASFNVQDYFKLFRDQDSTIIIKWYSDSTLKDSVTPVYITNKIDTLYAQLTKGICSSGVTKIILNISTAPLATPVTKRLCSDSSGFAEFYLPDLRDSINGKTNLNVEFSEDSLFTVLIGPAYKSKGGIVYARVKDGNCISNIVRIEIIADKSPDIFAFNDTIACEYFILPPFTGINLTNIAGYYEMPMGQGKRYNIGDTLFNENKIYLYDFDGRCGDSHEIELHLANALNAGRNNNALVCDGTQLDVAQLLNGADPGGIFIDAMATGRLTGQILNSTGQNGKTFTIYYIVDGDIPCGSDTAVLSIQVENSVTAPPNVNISLCEGQSVDLFPFLPGATSGGVFIDPGNTGALNNGRWDSNISGLGTFALRYEVGDNVTCPKVTSQINLTINPQIDILMPSQLLICDSFVLPPIVGKRLGSNTAYFTDILGGGRKYVPGEVISGMGSISLYIFSEEADHCNDQDTIEIFFGRSSSSSYVKNNLCYTIQENVGGEIFDRNRPNGLVRIQRGNLQCDSVISVQLTFLPEIKSDYKAILCENQSITIGKSSYDINRKKGTEIFPAGSVTGCDSIVEVDLTFRPLPRSNYSDTLCDGEFIVINGQRFDQTRSSGDVVYTAMQMGECDSTVSVNLNFFPAVTTIFSPVLCKGEQTTINGRIYDENNLSGTDTLRNASIHGCDSAVSVRIQLLNPIFYSYSDTICKNDFVIVGSKRADFSNPNVTDTLTHASINGCDSIISLRLQFFPENTVAYSPILCPNDFETINGNRYDINRPAGLETFSNAGQNRCDSTIQIQLRFYQEADTFYQAILCENQFITINGKRYDKNNASGIEILQAASANGCDSTINISLQFNSAVSFNYNQQICNNESVIINGKTYDANRLRGVDTLSGAATGGCDSIIIIELSTKPTAEKLIREQLCANDFHIINGKRYDINNKSGVEMLSRGAVNGCDSTIRIELSFEDLDIMAAREYTIAPGQTIQLALTPNFMPKQIEWTPATGLSCTDCLNPIASPIENTVYQVRLISENGCELIIQIRVIVSIDDDVYFPNVFSPNSDDINDELKVISSNPNLRIHQFMVFDRWGELIYTESERNYPDHKGWNGEFNARPMNPGVYVYYLRYSVPGGIEKSRKGDITLIR